MRKVLLILSVMLLSISMLFAAQEMSVTWEWLLDDPEVNYYRYQLNGTDEDGWTVVSGDTATYLAEGLDPYQDYTLYLERSYDGVNWSETASATAEALLVAEPVVEEEVAVIEEPVEEVVVEEPVAEEVVVEEPVEEVVVEEEEVVAEPVEEAVVEEEAVIEVAPVAPVEEKSAKAPLEFSLLFRPYVVMNFDWGTNTMLNPIGVGAGISLDFDNVIAFSENSGLGLRFDVGSTQYADGGFSKLLFEGVTGSKLAFWNWNWDRIVNLAENYYHDVNATLLFILDARAGIADFSFGLGGGAAVLFGAINDPIDYPAYNFAFEEANIELAAFGAANVGMKFYMGSVFSLGVDAVYKVMIPNYENNELDASVVFGFTF